MRKRFGCGNYQYEVVPDWGQLRRPCVVSDVSCDSHDRVYLAVRDSPYPAVRSGAILVFDKDGSYIKSWGEGLVTTPHGIWVSPEDEIYLTDASDHTVRKFSPAGDLLMTLGTKGKKGAPGKPLAGPTNAVESQSGEIYVTDGYQQNRVHRFTHGGELVLSWGSGDPVYEEWEVHGTLSGVPGTGPGEFNLPHGIALDKDDRVYIMDRENHRCQIFNTRGEYLSEWRNIHYPQDAVIDQDGVMHIAEGNHGICVMTLDGQLIGRWGEKGSDAGQFRGARHGLWIDLQGDLYVAEVGTEKAIHKFARV